jgi:hypothetical protein
MKPLVAIFLSILAAAQNALIAETEIDVGLYRIKLPRAGTEFVPSAPTKLDARSIERGWRYALRYVHDEPKDGLSFALFVTRQKSGPFILALHQAKEVTLEVFDSADDQEKLRIASATKVIDQTFAQELYVGWVNALFRARFDSHGGIHTGGDYYYISAFSLDTGFMHGKSTSFKSTETTGKIRDIGVLLKEYVEQADADKSKRIENRIRRTLKSMKPPED